MAQEEKAKKQSGVPSAFMQKLWLLHITCLRGVRQAV
jgi:hypothetical protein